MAHLFLNLRKTKTIKKHTEQNIVTLHMLVIAFYIFIFYLSKLNLI